MIMICIYRCLVKFEECIIGDDLDEVVILDEDFVIVYW